jgi:hypothetical protein
VSVAVESSPKWAAKIPHLIALWEPAAETASRMREGAGQCLVGGRLS